jgi:O-antigen/teichoic acid export membrane protein
LYFAARAHLPRATPSRVPALELLRAAWPLGVASLCQQAYFYVDNLFVRALCKPEDLGAYNIAVRMLSILIIGAIYATQAALPWLAREHAQGRLGEALARLAQPLLALAGIGAGFLCPWSERILSISASTTIAGASLRWLPVRRPRSTSDGGHDGAVAAGRSRSILSIAASRSPSTSRRTRSA